MSSMIILQHFNKRLLNSDTVHNIFLTQKVLTVMG